MKTFNWADWGRACKGAMRQRREVKRAEAEYRNDPENSGRVSRWSCGHKHSPAGALKMCGVVTRREDK